MTILLLFVGYIACLYTAQKILNLEDGWSFKALIYSMGFTFALVVVVTIILFLDSI